MIDGFLHPGIALGALLAAVPLIIHLLNRRRHKPLEWGAMRFVLAAYKRTRRRAQLENLLLLLLRMAAVALLAWALARPYLGRDALLAPLAESQRHQVLILDASASTGFRGATTSSFERIKERAEARLRELDGSRGDRAYLILGADPPQLLAWRDPSEALSVLGALGEPSDSRLDLAGCLALADEAIAEARLNEGGAELEIVLLTDLQRSSFGDAPGSSDVDAVSDGAAEALAASGERTAPWQERLDTLGERGLTLLVEDLGPADRVPANLGLRAVEPLDSPGAPGEVVELLVEVENFGTRAKNGLRIALEVDGERLPSRTVDVAAGGRAEVRFRTLLSASGLHVLEASLEGDGLAFDDRRASVVHVPPPLRVLGVNGAPDPDRLEEDELGFFRAALLPPSDGGPADFPPPFETTIVDRGELAGGRVDLDDFDVVVLANVETLPSRVVAELAERVREGAGLVFTLGDRVSAEEYGQRFFAPDGSGLLPAELISRVAVSSRRTDYWRVTEFDAQSPVLAFFDDERWRPYWTEVPYFEFFEVLPLEDAKVLARLDESALDERGAPLLVERAFGRGKTFLWTSSIDPAWTRMPQSPRTLIPFVHELVRHGGTMPGPDHELELGGALVAEFGSFPRGTALVRPDGSRRVVDAAPRELPGGRWSVLAAERVDRAGVWRVETEEGSDLPFAALYDPSEGDLERLQPAELESLHPGLAVWAPDEGGGAPVEAGAGRGELWRWLAALCLAALVMESLFAAWLGHRRGGAGGAA